MPLIYLQNVQLLNLFGLGVLISSKVSVGDPDNLGDSWNLLVTKCFSSRVHNVWVLGGLYLTWSLVGS